MSATDRLADAATDQEIQDSLFELCRRDATISYLWTIANSHGWTDLDMYKRMVVALGREKQFLQEQLTQTTEMALRGIRLTKE